MCRRLLRLGLVTATSCLLLVNAEAINAGRAGLAPRLVPNANLVDRAASINALSDSAGDPKQQQHRVKRNPAAGEEAGDSETGLTDPDANLDDSPRSEKKGAAETNDEALSASKTHKAEHATIAPGPLPTIDPGDQPMNALPVDELVDGDGPENTLLIEEPAIPTKSGKGGKEGKQEKAMPTEAPAKAFNHGAPEDEYMDDQPLDDCEDEPATVYVTVTVDENGNPAGPTPVLPIPVPGGGGGGENGGGGAGEPGECIEGCYDGDTDKTPVVPAPVPEPTADPEEEEPIEEEEEEPTEEEPADEGDLPEEDEGDGWDDVAPIGGAISASASASAGLDDFSGATGQFNGTPVFVSLAVCALTSIAAGFFFAGH